MEGSKIKADLPPEFNVAVLCQEMHWTYWDYLEAPQWMINAILGKMQAESDHQKKQAAKNK